ncbi:hypothetical protein FLK61_23565 [Paenalkalicoccus suaedae]|uniref:Uncharacterized protein n=1 Tax=Paenalkalicoccus suaedae TaxID=2592382 RepID=A0A859FB53_9BACI|nr:hypothetical protein [Paenalkalicoccus suaedae]QKS69774.1 hypothetical protein FLK61_23565 [Paenalkalicoccus suaedae]
MAKRKHIWTEEQDARITEVILDYVASGRTRREALIELAKEFDKERGPILNRWNQVLRPTLLKELEEAKIEGREAVGKKARPAWTPEIDQQITTIVMDFINSGKTQLKAFEHAGKELDIATDVVRNRWQSVLRLDKSEEIKLAKANGKENTYVDRLEERIRAHEDEIKKLKKMIKEHQAKQPKKSV